MTLTDNTAANPATPTKTLEKWIVLTENTASQFDFNCIGVRGSLDEARQLALNFLKERGSTPENWSVDPLGKRWTMSILNSLKISLIATTEEVPFAPLQPGQPQLPWIRPRTPLQPFEPIPQPTPWFPEKPKFPYTTEPHTNAIIHGDNPDMPTEEDFAQNSPVTQEARGWHGILPPNGHGYVTMESFKTSLGDQIAQVEAETRPYGDH